MVVDPQTHGNHSPQGYTEVRYDEERKRVVYEPLQLTQAFRLVPFPTQISPVTKGERVGTLKRSHHGSRWEMAPSQRDLICSNPSHHRLERKNRKNRQAFCYYSLVIHDKDTTTLCVHQGFILLLNFLPRNQSPLKIRPYQESTPSCH
jgi:hypothetical protein